MLSIIIVLGGIIAAMNISNYVKIHDEYQAILNLLCDNGGKFPQTPQGHKPDMGGMSEETPYETRYFTVTLFDNGQVISDVDRIAAISAQTAEAIAQKLFNDGKTQGMSGDYMFKKVDSEGYCRYVFIDCGRGLSTFKNFLSASTLISCAGVVLVFVLVIIFSRIVFKPVEESYAKQKMFITNAGHDIKTPLTVINADAEVLEIEQGESEWTTDIKRQIARLTALTEKLVFLARLDEGCNNLDIKTFNLSSALEETCLSYSSAVKVKGLSLNLDIDGGINYNGDEYTLRQASALLMDNAVKYTKDGGSICVSLKKQGKSVRMVFTNDVEGLKEGNCDNLFERFYRADKSRSSSNGNGIGLSAVKSIVVAHKGKISAICKQGKIIQFTIIL
jgi:hypothetical protein